MVKRISTCQDITHHVFTKIRREQNLVAAVGCRYDKTTYMVGHGPMRGGWLRNVNDVVLFFFAWVLSDRVTVREVSDRQLTLPLHSSRENAFVFSSSSFFLFLFMPLFPNVTDASFFFPSSNFYLFSKSPLFSIFPFSPSFLFIRVLNFLYMFLLFLFFFLQFWLIL